VRDEIAPPAAINSCGRWRARRSTFAEAGGWTGCSGPRDTDPGIAIIQSQRRLGNLAERTQPMKTFTIATVILSLVAMHAMPAHAQGKRPHGGEEKKAKDDRPKVDESAYKAALERIPEPKEKYDPWAVTKPVEPAKKPK
jgi:hypothetical protein